ncbi:5-formyltetrahydrofolate cyclo-ligase [Paenibacillus sp. IB182496]|uniref:5-formyltetrahydrofolate cyclo-ligase n=1 Tax=Paenibacillus sabuli TaxID=2772509 RepID=A0A927GT22_9BACL|nr:5-formyltetrahydrofolate cyclo-ligase [Paenibacillus sabuli]MBD2847158.1 5-formyltetrahydrofolate cyclo-ligase [Paenibacillus sabuli]
MKQATNDPSSEGKRALRQEMRTLRDRLDAASRDAWSARVCDRAARWLTETGAARPMLYAPWRSEVDTGPLIERLWRAGLPVLLPRCEPATRAMTLYRIRSWDELMPGAYGIREPDPRRATRCEEGEWPDAVLAPGLAFDRDGGRLGYGGGYYDRFRERMDAAGADAGWVGLAFEAQLVARVPLQPHDAAMDAVMTERAVYIGPPGGAAPIAKAHEEESEA